MSGIIFYPAREKQAMEGFGVSGAWWAQIVGGWTQTDPDSGLPIYSRVAQLLFDKEKGIGLTCYRHNLGGGSKDSQSSVFDQPSRMTECHLKRDGTYNWMRDENAVRMLLSCVEHGCEEVILFCNTPPEKYTINGKSCCSRPGAVNIKRKNFAPFAEYCVTVARHFMKLGVPVRAISPINEPVWIWTEKNGQEGCHYRPWQAWAMLRVFARRFKKEKWNVLLAGAENGDLRWFNKVYTRIMLGDKKIKSVSDGVDVHSYFLPLPLKLGKITDMANDRIAFVKRYRKWLDKHYPQSKVRVSEWTHMQSGRDYGMSSAMVQAQTMLEDITLLRACAWQNWIAVSNVDYCDGLLYIDENKPGFAFTKRYYAFGNFSKYIPVGATHIESSCDNQSLSIAAFKNGKDLICIVLNPTDAIQNIELPQTDGDVLLVVTDDEQNLAEHTVQGTQITLTPHSVNTILISGGTA